MTREFGMADIRLMAYYLTIEVKQREEDIFYLPRKLCEGDTEEIQE